MNSLDCDFYSNRLNQFFHPPLHLINLHLLTLCLIHDQSSQMRIGLALSHKV
ncbi:hypothetical protein LINPERHAP2_LOCUS16064 [Linum perenne]